MAKLGLGTRLAQGAHQRQDMVLAPRMLQSIEVLAMPVADLESWLVEQAESNEALLVEPERSRESLEPTRSRASLARASDDHHALLESQPDRGRSVADLVDEEIAARDLGDDLSSWIRFLGGCLDDGGLLAIADERLRELAEEAALPLAGTGAGDALLADAIATLQQFEPCGIGARSSVEALLLQLDPADDDYGVLCRLLEDFLLELSRNRRSDVAKELGLEIRELDRLLGVLERLDLRPAAGLVGVDAPVIVPDIIVLPDGESFSVELARGALPSVTIDPVAEELLGEIERGSDARKYLARQVEKAKWIAESVQMRGVTLLRVAEAALRTQVGFLNAGPEALVPLAMKSVAEELELATSTVSRAVAGKTVQTPWGIVPLRDLFQTSAGESTTGTSSTAAVREQVRRLIEAEDPAKPLSDEAIVETLRGKGNSVARRTVAKYRKELGIPSSYRRRREGQSPG